MIEALLILLGCQLAGEVAAELLALPVPGPVLGLLLLLLLLAVNGRVGESLAAVSTALLTHLSLLFVPAGVGIVRHMDAVAAQWPALLATLAGSTVLTLAVTAGVMHWLARRLG